MLFSFQSHGQVVKQTRPKGQKFIPPIFGTWRTGEVIVGKREDNNSPVKRAVSFDAMDDALSLLPPGLLVEFEMGFDKVAREAYYEMTFVPPFPPESCQYGSLWATCVGEAGSKRPDPNHKPIKREFSLYIKKVDVYETFGAVGATTKDVCYQVRGNGHTWEGYYFISKDGQTMWGDVDPGDVYTLEADGTKKPIQLPATILQVYHRVPENARR